MLATFELKWQKKHHLVAPKLNLKPNPADDLFDLIGA